jgi:hypothetical protein
MGKHGDSLGEVLFNYSILNAAMNTIWLAPSAPYARELEGSEKFLSIQYSLILDVILHLRGEIAIAGDEFDPPEDR